MDAARLLSLLEQTARLPTAPYHEGEVIAHATDWCEARGIGVRRDPFGNLVLRAGPVGGPATLAFAAHMDHPGFEITDTSGPLVQARWMGGVEPEFFPGAKVWVFSEPPTMGVCVKTELQKERRRVDTMFLDLEGEVRVGDHGTWHVLEWDVEGPLVHTRAADDLVGCAAVLAALTALAADGRVTAWGLLTRAEEVGFHGALGAMKAGALPEGTPIVSLECSKALPSARQGEGPVIRVGDRSGVFDAGLCRFLEETAKSIHERFDDFVWQRALMDGGTCESTPYGLFGHPTAGLAFPLGNYHNRADDGRRLAAENIHVGDFFGGVTLLVEAARRYPTHGANVLDDQRAAMLERAEAGMRRLANDGLAGD